MINPTTEEVIGRVPEGSPEDADRGTRRAGRVRDLVSDVALRAGAAGRCDRRSLPSDELGVLIATELGMPLTLSRMIQAGLPSVTFSSQTELVEEIAWEEGGNSLIVREPVGVVAAITLELSAQPDRQQGGSGAHRRLHGRAQAERGGAAVHVRAG